MAEQKDDQQRDASIQLSAAGVQDGTVEHSKVAGINIEHYHAAPAQAKKNQNICARCKEEDCKEDDVKQERTDTLPSRKRKQENGQESERCSETKKPYTPKKSQNTCAQFKDEVCEEDEVGKEKTEPSIYYKKIEAITEWARSIFELANFQHDAYFPAAKLFGEEEAVKKFEKIMSESCKAFLEKITSGCLVFTFLHETMEQARYMMANRTTVLTYIHDFLKELDADLVLDNVELCVQIKTGSGQVIDQSHECFSKVSRSGFERSCNSGPAGDARSESSHTVRSADLEISGTPKHPKFGDETGVVDVHSSGKLWRLTEVYSQTDELQNSVKIFEEENANTDKMILLLSSADRQDKMNHLFRETEILKLFDIHFQGLLELYHLPTTMALEALSAKQDPSGERHQRQEADDYMRHVVVQLKKGIGERRDLFAILGDMMKQVKCILPYLQVKTAYLKQATSGNLMAENLENRSHQSVFKGLPNVDQDTFVEHTAKDDECVAEISLNTKLEVTSSVQGGLSAVTQTVQDDACDRTNAERTQDLKAKLKMLEMEAENKKKELNKILEATDHGVEWEYNMGCLSQNMAQLKIQDLITDVIGENEIPVMTDKPLPFLDIDCSTGPAKRQSHVHKVRKLQFGAVTQRELLGISRNLITDDQTILTDLRTQSDRLEHKYGCPIHIVGELESEKSGPVSCPAMTLDPDRVNERLSVSESGELVNGRGSGGDQRGGRLQRYWGTCSRLPIPLPPSPSTLTAPRYWETQSRIQLKDVSRLVFIQELGVCGEEEVDTGRMVAVQSGSSWSVLAVDCAKHGEICTRVWGEGRLCGGCHRNYLSLTPGTGVHTIHWGSALDIGRGRLAFVDVTRGRVIHKFDVDIRESLRPMFGVTPSSNVCDVKMKLLSGSEIAMDDRKKDLIGRALFSAANVSE